jgi:mRNA interferase MazF
MPSTTQCNTGDVILVPFKFAETDVVKPRPAIIVSVADFQNSRSDAVMLALTSQQGRDYFGDCQIVDWRVAGLAKPSIAKGVIRTIARSLVYAQLGTLTAADMERVRQSIRLIFGV